LTRPAEPIRGLLVLAALAAAACATASGALPPDAPATSPPAETSAVAPRPASDQPATTLGTSAPATAAATSPAPPDAAIPRTALMVFKERCASCHTDGANAVAAKHFKVVDDKPAGHHEGSLGKTLRKVLGVTGKATMPKGGPFLSDRDRDLLVAWADERDAAAPARPHKH
jgi:mono/diheme cytochrome c family protein